MDKFVRYDTVQCISEKGVFRGIVVTTLSLNKKGNRNFLYGIYIYKYKRDICLDYRFDIEVIYINSPIDIKRCKIVLIEKIYNKDL